MKNLGIGDDNEDAKYDDDATNEISSFLEILYKPCKKFRY